MSEEDPEFEAALRKVADLVTGPVPAGSLGLSGGLPGLRRPPRQPRSEVTYPPFTGGPQEALERYRLNRYGMARFTDARTRQLQLFNPEDPEVVKPLEAHQQTPEQFAADPRTWWHGRVVADEPSVRLGAATSEHAEGFHAGTRTSAAERVTSNVLRRGVAPGMGPNLFPLRVTGPVDAPETPQADVSRHHALQARGSGYLYQNEHEDIGSMSIGVPQRRGYLSTHREMVRAAQARGEYVHPGIQQLAELHPETHFSGVGELFRPPSTEGVMMSGFGVQKSLPGITAPYSRTARDAYVTHRGERVVVERNLSYAPGSAHLGRQWRRVIY